MSEFVKNATRDILRRQPGLSSAEINREFLSELRIQLGLAARCRIPNSFGLIANFDPRPHVRIALECADHLGISHADCYRYMLALMSFSNEEFWTFVSEEEMAPEAWLLDTTTLPEPAAPLHEESEVKGMLAKIMARPSPSP